MDTRISRLLIRKGEVSIELGRLVVRQPNGEEVGQGFLNKYSQALLCEILTALPIDAYEYSSYETGYYGGSKHAGVTLQFASVTGDVSTYTIFNVGLTRIRTTKSGKKGSPLPKGHFIVTERHDFYKFWKSTALAIPKSLTSFHDYMGNLKGILFTTNLTEGRDDGRMIASSIRPLSISPEIVRQVFLPDKSRITSRHVPDNCHIKTPDKKPVQPQAGQALQAKSTACDQCYGKTVIRRRDGKGANSTAPRSNRVEDQSDDEWDAGLNRPED